MHTVKKSYRDLPAAHRQPKHDGHCRLIHGHNWGFDIVLGCTSFDPNGFVLDVGKLKPVKDFLTETFDHTLLLNEDDPLFIGDELEAEFDMLRELSKLVKVPNCGMEGLAQYVFEEVQLILERAFNDDFRNRGLRVVEVTCFEDSKNSSTYTE